MSVVAPPPERVFEELHRVVEEEVYATLDDKVAAVVARLEWLEADPTPARALTHWSWIAAAFHPAAAQNAA